MSAGSKGLRVRAIQVVATALTFGLLFGTTQVLAEFEGVAALVAAVGFLLIAGMLVSELVELVGLPHLTGYILAGVVAGPYALHLVDHDTVERLQGINSMALSLIALAGGAELRLDMLRSGWRSLATAAASQTAIVMGVSSIAFVALAPHIPFAAGFELSPLIAVALLWGVLSVSRSPAATLAILSQERARGPVSRFSLASVMLSDVVVVFALALVLALIRPLADPEATLSFEAMQAVGREVAGSVSIGATVGLLLAAYLRIVGRQVGLVLVGIGFVGSDLIHYLHFDPVLCFLVAGFVVANLSNQAEKLLGSIEAMGSVVFVVFFATAGAHLDLPLISALWPVALGLCGARALATWVAHRISSRLASDPPEIRRHGWASLVSQAGLTLGLSTVVERAFPEFGAGFRSLIIATVAINELWGPVLFKIALNRAGEAR